MRRFSLRLVGAVLLLGALGGVVAAPASAHIRKATKQTRPLVSVLTETQSSAHAIVHYTTAGEHATTAAAATHVLDLAEQAWAVEVGEWGYPAPLDDGDGKIDFYVHLIARDDVAGYASSDEVVGTGATGYIGLTPKYLSEDSVVSHEFFHLLQLAMWNQASPVLMEATADWAQVRMGYPQSASWRFSYHTSLTCTPGEQQGCGAGHERWPFVEFIANRHGATIVRDLFDRGRAAKASSLTGMLRGTLSAYGTSLEREYAAFALATIGGGGHTSPHLGRGYPVYQFIWSTYTPIREAVALPRLAMRLIPISPAGVDTDCRATTLRLTVKLPNEDASVYVAPARAGELPTRLPAANGIASGVIPWSTCVRGVSRNLLLVNASSTQDDQQFAVEADVVSGLTPTAPPASAPSVPSAPVVPPAVPAEPKTQVPSATPAKPATPATPTTPTPPSIPPAGIHVRGDVTTRRGSAAVLAITVPAAGLLQVACARGRLHAEEVVRAGANTLRLHVERSVPVGRYTCDLSLVTTNGGYGGAARFVLVVR